MNSAFEVADRIAMLHEGKIHALGTVNEIRESKDLAVRQFLEGKVIGPLTQGILDGGLDEK